MRKQPLPMHIKMTRTEARGLMKLLTQITLFLVFLWLVFSGWWATFTLLPELISKIEFTQNGWPPETAEDAAVVVSFVITAAALFNSWFDNRERVKLIRWRLSQEKKDVL